MSALLVLSLLVSGQLEVKDGNKLLKLSSEGLTLRTGGKVVTLSGAGAVAKVDGGSAFTGIGQTTTHACAPGEDVDLSGTNNDLTLTGACGAVTASGLGNRLSIESAASLDVSGKNNTVSYSGAVPSISRSGSGNQVLRAK